MKSGTSDQTKQNDQSPYTYGRTDTPETKQGTHTHSHKNAADEILQPIALWNFFEKNVSLNYIRSPHTDKIRERKFIIKSIY